MLEPQNRLPLQEALVPPPGYVLDYALGTTFSLDLMTLLTVPLSFTFSNGRDDIDHVDPLLLLEGIRRLAGRMTVFCQAGQIAVPKSDQLLYGYLESSVVEVLPRSSKGVFHPKVWALRYVPDEDAASDDPVRYRLLVMSRNLTFDRSWDTMLLLDGVLTGRKNALSRLHPLGDFIADLPNLALRPVAQPLADKVDQMQYELRRTEFELPRPFTEIDYVPLGLKPGKSWPFSASKSAFLIVSPFLAAGFLERFSQGCRSGILISRLESLAEIKLQHLQKLSAVYVLSPNADLEEETAQAEEDLPLAAEAQLSGLHAKLFIEEQGRQATLWTGSANATNAAFEHNVEFMVRLEGKRSEMGIKSLLSEETGDQVGLFSLLEPYTFRPPAAGDPVQQQLAEQMLLARRRVVEAALQAEVSEENGRYTINLQPAATTRLEPGQSARCWPVTLPDNHAVPLALDQKPAAIFRSLSFESISGFFAFELTVHVGAQTLRSRFVQNLPLINPPADRQERLLRALLSDENRVLRYLILLLAAEGHDGALDVAVQTMTRPPGDHPSSSTLLPVDLFESLVRTLADSPSRLDQIQRLVADLQQTGSLDLLPADFMAIWPQIWAVRQQNAAGDSSAAAAPTPSPRKP